MENLKKAKSYLLMFNFYPYNIYFTIHGKKGYNTVFSFIITLLTFAIQLYLLHYFSYDFINQKNPNLNYKETEFKDRKILKLDDILMKSRLEHEFLYKSLKTRGYIPPIPLMKKHNVTEFDLIKLKLEISNNHKEDDIEHNFSRKEHEFTYEFTLLDSIKTNFKWEMYIYFNSTINSDSLFRLNHTDFYYNETKLIKSNSTITDKTKIKDMKIPIDEKTKIKIYYVLNDLNKEFYYFLRPYYTEFHFKDYIIDLEKKDMANEYPFIWRKKTFEPVTPDMSYPSHNIEYEFYDVKDDTGILFSHFKENSFPKKISNSEGYTVFNANVPISILEISFNRTKKVYQRIYKKIQNVFAESGGIFSSLIVIGGLLTSFINEIIFNSEMINSIFNNKGWNKNHEEDLSEDNIIQKKVKELNIMKEINKDKNLEKKMKNFIQSKEFYYLDKSYIKKNKKEGNIDIDWDIQENYNCLSSNKKSANSLKKDNDNEYIPLDKEKIMKNIKQLLDEQNEENDIKDLFYARKIKDRKTEENHFSYGPIKYFRSFLPCKRNKEIELRKLYYDKAKTRMDSIFDFQFYTELVEEIEKIKYLILNKQQNVASIFVKRKKLKDFWKKNYEEEIYEAAEYFHNPNNNNHTDEKIREKFNKTFCELIH